MDRVRYMKWTGSFSALSIIIVLALFIVVDHRFAGQGSLIQLLIIVFIVLLVWWIGKKYDEVQYKYIQLKKEKEKIEERQSKSNQKIKHYECLFNSLDGAIFSYDVLNDQVYYSKGIEQLFGYTNENFNRNPNVWKEIIHPEDAERVNRDDEQLLAGHSSNVEFRIIHPDFDEKWVIRMAVPIKNQDGSLMKINGQIIDITERKQLENELKQMAYFDDLTDLPNRKLLDRHIEKALARSKRHNHNFILMFIDLDDFKLVNDTMGHEAGDLLLKEVVKRLNENIREEDLISRIGGDEFIIVFEDTSMEEIEAIAQRIIDFVSLPYMINEKEAKVSVSIGVSMYPNDGEDKETLIEHADKAMYFAKNNGKNSYKIYDPELDELVFKKAGLLESWMNTIQKSKLFNS